MKYAESYVQDMLTPPGEAVDDFEAFFRAEGVTLFRVLVFVTRDVHEAEDLMQEAFAKVWERWDRVRSMENPAGYLHRTAMNGYFQSRRRARRAANRLMAPMTGGEPGHAVEARDMLERALLRLPARQRAALVVTELLGYDSASAARVLGIRPGTVRRLVSQAKSRIRGDIDEQEGRDDG